MQPNCLDLRIGAFRTMLHRSKLIPEEDHAIEGVLRIVVTAYLLGLEAELYERAKAISDEKGPCLTRRTKYRLSPKAKQKYRVITVGAILALACYFNEVCQSDEMVGLLTLLASLAVDDSEHQLWKIAKQLVTEASQSDPALWLLLEHESPQLCRLMEEEAN